MANKPVFEFRDGLLKVSVWENARKEGDRTFFTFDLKRSYKDEGGNWHETASLTGDDALKGANLLQQAYNASLKATSRNRTQDTATDAEYGEAY